MKHQSGVQVQELSVAWRRALRAVCGSKHVAIRRLRLALVLLTDARMQREQKSPQTGAKLFMAFLLAVPLLAFGGFMASGKIHHSFHHDHSANPETCVICSLALGQIEIAAGSPALAATPNLVLCGLLAANAGVPCRFDFLLPPGRAPPGLPHSH
jgi:hypothetical protein